nr:MAG TPA: hypothetical protein [Caudoviricetes sp.]
MCLLSDTYILQNNLFTFITPDVIILVQLNVAIVLLAVTLSL